ncbi:hypothetical protein CAS74_002377 [Pichia kudriavzevii]|uniref:Translation initiation factor eIF2B subunit gamma n=2 Tax=Pichia kudriavzevii TaxID=4909 RepID=A0A1V2LNI5_PICKU|nr:Translation initiation factor eIF-2B subunit gamma [Pichia kudriavzevii]OUT22633.1 hypothetical protein CAS74_002377 [Pichia kudriavzevii]
MEFNAVVFCGDGQNLGPLTSPGESRIPKALLPVANKPLIEYVLEWCDQAPFKSVNLVTDMKNEKMIAEVITAYNSKRNLELRNSSPVKLFTSELKSTGAILNDIFPVKEEDEYEEENYIILPCDFITDVPPQVFIEVYRGNSDENMGLSVFYYNCLENIDKKVLKSNYTVYSNQENGNSVLLDMYSKDFVTIDKFLKIRTQLLWRYPTTSISTKLLDSFIFFMNGKCRTTNKNNEDIETSRSINKVKRDLARNSWKHSSGKSTIGMFALPRNAFFVRVNNLPVYMEVNRHYLKEFAKSGNRTNATKGSANIGVDCLVEEDAEIGERTTVKRSVIGKDVKIGKKCRISASVILDGVTIEDEVQLENCIIGKNVKIEYRGKLVNCNVEGSYTVGKNVNLKGETLKNLNLDELSDGGVFYEGSEDETTDESGSEGGVSEYDDEGFEEEEYEDDIFAR